MDSHLPHHHEPDPRHYANDSGAPPEDEETDDGPATETLMEALARVISVDPATGHIEGCANDFRITEDALRRHEQEEVAEQVLALLRAQGAHCDCEVLLQSRIDLVFLEDDLEFEDDEDEEEEYAT
ncbi:MAG TPA: DUF2695 domain-containing protein [Chloroflexia bacterium]|nr:DUF2695 domain-containing protein [Chloroflexia bacterium]